MQYQSPFEDWYTDSTVHKPFPDFTCETGLVLFPPQLVPGVGHPLVDKLGNHATRRLMMRKLESYNAFTEKLEYKAVMAASIKLAQDPQAFGLSERAGREAQLIVTDESHHAYVAIELIKRIPGFSELPPLAPSQPPFLRGLEELEKSLPTEFADDLLIAFWAVFVVPVAPRERPWFSFGGLQGRLVGSTAVRFFDANGSGRLIPSAGAARHHPICPGPTPDPKSTAKPTDGIRKGSAKSWG